jgi:hypothetical protein
MFSRKKADGVAQKPGAPIKIILRSGEKMIGSKIGGNENAKGFF